MAICSVFLSLSLNGLKPTISIELIYFLYFNNSSFIVMASYSLIPLYIGIDTQGDVFGSIIFKSYTMCTPLVLFAEIDRASYITLLTP